MEQIFLGKKRILIALLDPDSLCFFRWKQTADGKCWTVPDEYADNPLRYHRLGEVVKRKDWLNRPIEVLQKADGTYEVWDGGHRIAAHCYLGHKTIMANVYQNVPY